METGKLNGAVKGSSIFPMARPGKAGLADLVSRDAWYTLNGRWIGPRGKALRP